MFYHQSQIDAILLCQNCGNLFHNPKLLPCGESVCESCLKNIMMFVNAEDNTYLCPMCNQSHELPEDGVFISNKVLESLLRQNPAEFVSDESMLNLRQILDHNLKKLAQLDKIHENNGINRVTEYCREIRSEIKVASMQTIEDIYRQHSWLLKKVDVFEEECLKYLGVTPIDINVKYLVKEVKDFDLTWRSCLNRHKINKKDVSAASELGVKIGHQIECKIRELNSIIFNDKTLEFKRNCSAIPTNIIGKLSTTASSPQAYTLHNTLFGHTDCVDALKVLINGDLVSASWDKTLKIWDLTTGEVKKTLRGHTDSINDMIVLKNSEIASASDDKTIRIWNSQTGDLKAELLGHTGYVFSLTVLKNGDLVSCSGDNSIKIWNVETGSCVRTLTGHTGIVYSLVVMDNGDLVSGSKDQSIKIWKAVKVHQKSS